MIIPSFATHVSRGVYTRRITFIALARALSFYNSSVLTGCTKIHARCRACPSIRLASFSFSHPPPPPRRQVVNEIAASGAARHAKLMKVCALRAFRSRLPSSGAERTRASTYDSLSLSFAPSLVCSLLMREHSRRDSRGTRYLAAGCAESREWKARGIPRAEINARE